MEKGVIGKNNRQWRTLRNYISAHTKRLVAHGKTILDGCMSVHQHALWVMQMPGVSRNGKKGNSGCEVAFSTSVFVLYIVDALLKNLPFHISIMGQCNKSLQNGANEPIHGKSVKSNCVSEDMGFQMII